jgi:hypothetical protein
VLSSLRSAVELEEGQQTDDRDQRHTAKHDAGVLRRDADNRQRPPDQPDCKVGRVAHDMHASARARRRRHHDPKHAATDRDRSPRTYGLRDGRLCGGVTVPAGARRLRCHGRAVTPRASLDLDEADHDGQRGHRDAAKRSTSIRGGDTDERQHPTPSTRPRCGAHSARQRSYRAGKTMATDKRADCNTTPRSSHDPSLRAKRI